MSARHVDRMPLCVGRQKGDAVEVHDLRPIRTVCSECGVVLQEGRTIDGMSSHGLCPRHYRMMMASLAIRAAGKYGTAIRNHDRQSDEVVRAHNRMVAAIYDIVDLPSDENGPDGGASQRAGSDGAASSGDDTPKVTGGGR